MVATIRKIQNEIELLKALNLCASAFMKKDPLFLSENVPIKDFVDYFFSIKNTILKSPFTYALYDENDQIKASFIGLPAFFKYQHYVPKSMQYYDDFFGAKFEKYIKLCNTEKCFYPLFTGSFYKGGARLMYIQSFKDLLGLGYQEMYYEVSNPVNGKIWNRYAEEFKWKVIRLPDAFYKNQIKIEFCRAEFNRLEKQVVKNSCN